MNLQRIRKIGVFLARPDIFSYALLWLTYLTIAGTLAQADIGLYRAQQIYFSSFIYWLGPIPLPGGYPAMAVVAIGLIANLIFVSVWRGEKLGILITHIGGLLLLFGGLLTAITTEEGNMVIPPDGTSNFFSEYHSQELAVTQVAGPGEQAQVTTFGSRWIQKGKVLKSSAFPFEIEILSACKNCEPRPRTNVPDGLVPRGFAERFELFSIPEAKESEQNQGGLTFKLTGSGSADGLYNLLEEMPVQQTIAAGGKNYIVEMRRSRTYLPFSLTLQKFEKKTYPGTMMAKSYKSVVTLTDGALSQRAVIQMNEPLRYKGYTFYQSSFVEHPSGDTTILAVVKNAGYAFPYISSIVMCIGLLIHLLIQSPKLIRRGGPGK